MGILDFVVWNVSPDIISSPVNIRWYGLMFAIFVSSVPLPFSNWRAKISHAS